LCLNATSGLSPPDAHYSDRRKKGRKKEGVEVLFSPVRTGAEQDKHLKKEAEKWRKGNQRKVV